MNQIDTFDGLAIYALRQEDCDTSILWLHGYTMDASIWSHIWSCMPYFNHYAIDLPSHGRSRFFTKDEDLSDLAKIVLKIIIKYDIKHIVGMSFGGIIALETAIEGVGLIDTLTCCSTGLAGGELDKPSQECNIKLNSVYIKKGVGPWMKEIWMSDEHNIFKGVKKYPKIYNSLSLVIAKHSWKELEDNSMEIFLQKKQVETKLNKIRSRTVIMVGEEDMKAFKRIAEIVRRSIPFAQRIHLPKIGHLGLLESPTATAEIIYNNVCSN